MLSVPKNQQHQYLETETQITLSVFMVYKILKAKEVLFVIRVSNNRNTERCRTMRPTCQGKDSDNNPFLHDNAFEILCI